MRTTLNLPEALLTEALKLTRKKTKTDVIIFALESLVKNEKMQRIKKFKGKIKLDIDIDALRQR